MTKAEKFYAGQNKLSAYDTESNNLILDAVEFDDVHNEKFSLPEIVYLLRKSFKERLTHKEVLDESEMDYRADPARGFCMISSYLIYSMTGGDAVWEIRGTPLHWWLYHKQSHTIFDITHTQFGQKELQAHYRNGINVKNLNKDPMFYDALKHKAHILAHRAGME